MKTTSQNTDDLVLGVANATNALIAESLDLGINLAIKELSQPLGVDAGFVTVNHHDDQGGFLTSMKYAWTPHARAERYARNQNVKGELLGEILSSLIKGHHYELVYSQANDDLKTHMGFDGSKSVIMFPINVEGDFWGILGLVDFHQERGWSDPEKSLLHSFANSIGNAVCRNKLEESLEALVAERTLELQNSRMRFQLAIEGSQDGIWDWQPNQNKAYWSPRMFEQLGYGPDEIPVPKDNFFDMLHPDDATEARERFERHMHDRVPYEVEFRLKTKSGEYRWFKSTGQALWADDGSVVRIVGSHEDIHDKKMAELDVKESHRRMNNLVNNLPGMVYRCLNDQEWTMQYLNGACEAITGYTSDEFYGDPGDVTFGELIHVDDRIDMWDQVQRALKANESFRVIYRIIDKRGKEKWLWEQGNGVYDENGELSALEGCIFDISPVVRNQELQHQAIYKAEDNERRRIAADIHDGLQQTLSVSALNLQYLEDEISGLTESSQERYAKSKEFLEQGIAETRSIAHRLMPKSIGELGLVRALQDLIAQVESSSAIECKYYSNLKGRLSTDMELGLYRTAQEALNNVIKSSHATHVNVQLVKVKNDIQLMIEDDGVGFDKNKLDLYETGYGLTGMKNRIAALSGSLTIDSRPDHGTSVIALVPLKE
ncbi:PAS domain-containing protein [Fabibacter sp. E12]|nr:PAS domain-containing protein [Roseivirga sp. E12]